MKRTAVSLHHFIPAFALLAALVMPLAADAAEHTTLQCSFKREGRQAPVITAGKAPEFFCLVKGDSASALLIGKQQFGKELPSTAATNLTLKNDLIEVPLTFPAVYQPGDYLYTFSLINTETKETLVDKHTVVVTLPGTAQPSIKDVTVDKNQYAWGESLSLTLTVVAPQGTDLTEVGLTTQADLQDKTGASCANLLSATPVTQATSTLNATLPKQAGNCINALAVSLTDKDGKTVDRKVVALGLPTIGATAPSSQTGKDATATPSFFASQKGFIVLAIIPVLLVLGYFFLRKRRTLEQQ